MTSSPSSFPCSSSSARARSPLSWAMLSLSLCCRRETDAWFVSRRPDGRCCCLSTNGTRRLIPGSSVFHRKSFSSLYHSTAAFCFSRFLSLSTRNHAFTPPYAPPPTVSTPPSHLCLPLAACLTACPCVGCVGASLSQPAANERARRRPCVFAPANVWVRICASRTEPCVVKVCSRRNFLLFNSQLWDTGRSWGGEAGNPPPTIIFLFSLDARKVDFSFFLF